MLHDARCGALTPMQSLLGRWTAVGIGRTRPAWSEDAVRDMDRGTWRDETWAALIGRFDTVLRRCNGVYEFTTEPGCVLRVGLGCARSTVELADGTRLQAGEPVGVLHLWNEHLPRFPQGGPDLHWAKTLHLRLKISLTALSGHVACDPLWQDVRAIRCGAAFSGAMRTGQLQRIGEAFGFEVIPADVSGLRRAHALGEDFLLWGFARAFNPATLHQQSFFRPRRDLWISRSTLLGRYGRPGRRARLSVSLREPA